MNVRSMLCVALLCISVILSILNLLSIRENHLIVRDMWFASRSLEAAMMHRREAERLAECAGDCPDPQWAQHHRDYSKCESALSDWMIFDVATDLRHPREAKTGSPWEFSGPISSCPNMPDGPDPCGATVRMRTTPP